MRARIKSITPRTKWRAVRASSRWDEPLLNEVLQEEKSITWTTLTVGKGDRRQRTTYKFWLAV
jgi:hypothetical protein